MSEENYYAKEQISNSDLGELKNKITDEALSLEE